MRQERGEDTDRRSQRSGESTYTGCSGPLQARRLKSGVRLEASQGAERRADVVQFALGRAALPAAGRRIWGGVSAGSGKTAEASATGQAASGGEGRGQVLRVPGRRSPEVCCRPGWQRRRNRKGSGLFSQNQGRLWEEGARGKHRVHPERDVMSTGADVQSSGKEACLQMERMGLMRHLLKPEVQRATRGPHVCSVKPA